ncbi:MAG: hypothetical protein WCH77_02285 [Planctomycetota bacterium]
MSEHTSHDETKTAAPRERGGDRLAALKSRIAQVGRRRRFMRRLSAASRLVLAIVIAAAVLFLIDWIFAPGRLARLLMLLVAAAAIARVYWRRVRPGLAARETDADIALLIEKQQGIDSDLVAALEFSNGTAAPGSADLRDAVVDYVADFGRTWQMPREAVDPKLRRRLAWLAFAVAVAGAAVAVRPDFAAAFANRMLLGRAHYPTRTRIESLTIAGQSVDPSPWAAASVPCPLGRPIGFEVGIAGETPRLVRLRLASVGTGGTTEIDLVPDAAENSTTYSARLPRLAESVDAQVFAGDAWTEPVRVRAIAPPLVDLALATTPPAYAGGRVERAPQGARQVTVLEGSRVDLALRCTNKKLASAALVVDGAEHPLQPRSADGGSDAEWELAGSASPLARLDRSIAYEIRIVDEDGLGADMPLVGSIRVKPDAPPRVTADVQTRLVLPSATPRLAWRVADDHAIAGLEIVVEPVSAAGDTDTQADASAEPTGPRPGRTATIPVTLSKSSNKEWVGGDRLPLEGVATVKLDGLGLTLGDQVRVFVRATDYRGDAAGQAAESEPILLEVTDERGILAGLVESDERSIEQLDAIIDRELKVGGAQ